MYLQYKYQTPDDCPTQLLFGEPLLKPSNQFR